MSHNGASSVEANHDQQAGVDPRMAASHRTDEEEEDTALRRGARARVLTEAGREHQLEIVRSECSRLEKRLDRQQNLIRRLLDSQGDHNRINQEAMEYDKMMGDISASFKRLIDLEDGAEKEAAVEKFNELPREANSFKEEIYLSLIHI